MAKLQPIVGILGGMGPEATVELMRRVVTITPASDDQDHIRMLVDHNPKVLSRIQALIDGSGDSPAPVLVDMAQRLERAGATLLAMPCNTAHAFAGSIAASVDIPLLDMIGLTTTRISRMVLRHRRVGMLASSAIGSLGLYDKALAELGIATIDPDRQQAVMGIIKAVKRGDTGTAQRRELRALAEELIADRADVLLLACTELSVIADGLDDDLAVINSLDVLVEAIVAAGLSVGVSSAPAVSDRKRRSGRRGQSRAVSP